ncbi:MAG: HepT-like ribonuclease domain-containing protein [Thermodesulfobacteriota bacterium]
MRDDRARLRDMLDCIENIEKYARYGRERFLKDDLVRTYIVHHLQVLGEAASKLGADPTGRYQEIPWPKILGMRHIIVHDYFRVNYDIVWDVVETELPILKPQLQVILDSLK